MIVVVVRPRVSFDDSNDEEHRKANVVVYGITVSLFIVFSHMIILH